MVKRQCWAGVPHQVLPVCPKEKNNLKKKIDENTFKPNHDNEFDNLKPVIRISIG